VAESDVIRTGNTLHIALRQRREERHHQTEDQEPVKTSPTPSKPATVRITPIMQAI
jgi:hypothetical protein